jgi:hypothetical protein
MSHLRTNCKATGVVVLSLPILVGILPGASVLDSIPPLGLLNAVKGEVSVNGVPVSAGRTTLAVGGVIRTGNGMAELLLNPGSFLRLGDGAELILKAAGGSDIHAKLTHGEALLEVLDPQTPIFLEQNRVIAVVRRPGLYDFDEKHAAFAVYDGEAVVSKDNRQMTLDKGLGVSAHGFHKIRTIPHPGSMLLSWSNSRSGQLSSESAASAQAWPGSPGSWSGPAWYWNAWSGSYTFLSASGFVTSPFGWPFYAPGYTHNYLPVPRGGDSFLYGPPSIALPIPTAPVLQGPIRAPQSVPLTAPGVPSFPNSRR